MSSNRSNDIKLIVENYNHPLLFKSCLDWEILEWDLNKWAKELKSEVLQYRKGKFAYTEKPQWESSTENIEGTIKNIMNIKNTEKYWLYFDYKYLKDWFINNEALKSIINWGNFGFPERTAQDSTIWIGTEGAHTPCHIDTYGCNLVAQIFGRKRWLLFPPDENLHPTRVPYEESSIYSKLNFFSPNQNDFKGISNCISIILKPGDVLFIPNGWWHYVENMETAISINTWLPLKIDKEKRINEAITQLLVKSMTAGLNLKDTNKILNPNENLSISIYESIEILNTCLAQFKASKDTINSNNTIESEGKIDVELILKSHNDKIEVLKKLTRDEFVNLISTLSARFSRGSEDEERSGNDEDNISSIINAFTDGDVVKLIKEKLILF